MKCQCELCSDVPHPLYKKSWLEHCEALSVARLRTDDDRVRYLDLVEKRRGKEARKKLRNAAWEIIKNGAMAR